MAVDNEQLKPRTRLPDGAPMDDTQKNVASSEFEGPDEPENQIQVPATQETIITPPQNVQAAEPHATHPEETRQSHDRGADEIEDEESATADDSTAELVPFDWEDLEKRYKAAIVMANDAETELVDEFEKVSAVSHSLCSSIFIC